MSRGSDISLDRVGPNYPAISGPTAVEVVDSHFRRGVRDGQALVPSDWDPSEPDQIIAEFSRMLRMATGDGAKKRAAGEKPSWKVDTSHEGAVFSHLCKWKRKETIDPESGAHTLVHAAWRLLAIAWQESQ